MRHRAAAVSFGCPPSDPLLTMTIVYSKNRPMSISRRAVAPFILLPLVLAGCSTQSTDEATDAASSSAETITVAAEIYPLAYYAEQIGGDLVEVNQIVPAGTPVHGYEMSPAEIADLSEKDLAIFITSLAAPVDDAIETAAPPNTIDVAEVIPTRPGTSEGAATQAAGIDSHMWLNPADQPLLVDAIAAKLTELNPAGAETFTANADALNARFEELDQDYTAGLASCERDTFIVTHPAFGYLAEEYALKQIGITGLDSETEPSPAKLEEVKAAAQASGATMILFSSTTTPQMAEVLANDLGLTTGVLSTIGAPPADKDYFQLAQANLKTLQQALGCA